MLTLALIYVPDGGACVLLPCPDETADQQRPASGPAQGLLALRGSRIKCQEHTRGLGKMTAFLHSQGKVLTGKVCQQT